MIAFNFEYWYLVTRDEQENIVSSDCFKLPYFITHEEHITVYAIVTAIAEVGLMICDRRTYGL